MFAAIFEYTERAAFNPTFAEGRAYDNHVAAMFEMEVRH